MKKGHCMGIRNKAKVMTVVLAAFFLMGASNLEASWVNINKTLKPIVDAWKCPSCGWDNDEDAMRCKICDRYK